jgi:GDP-L-fucose synthase
VLAAARVGGIMANATYPADFLSDNLRIQVNVLDAAYTFGVERLLFLGSSCIYPRLAEQPIKESSLLTGPLEPTNDAYAIAKISGVLQVQAQPPAARGLLHQRHADEPVRAGRQLRPGAGSHVLPALIRRFHEAKEQGAQSVTLWGTGTPRREFLHVDDLARACLFLLENYDDPAPINVGSGWTCRSASLAELVAGIVGYGGALEWDTGKPDGTPRKLLDVSRIQELGWSAEIPLDEGVRSTYLWYLEHVADLRA